MLLPQGAILRSVTTEILEMDERDRLDYAKWLLERQLHWIAAADTKAAGLVAAYVALAAIAATILDSHAGPPSVKVLFSIAGLASLPGLIYAMLVFYPRTSSDRSSLIYFAEIKTLGWPVFRERLDALTQNAVLEDLASQIEVNARIASAKHGHARNSMNCAVIALLVWLVAVSVSLVAS